MNLMVQYRCSAISGYLFFPTLIVGFSCLWCAYEFFSNIVKLSCVFFICAIAGDTEDFDESDLNKAIELYSEKKSDDPQAVP